jgi:hypothetical protein
MALRSFSVVPPQMPVAWWWSSAQFRHGARTGQARHIRLAWSAWRSAGPAVLIGKNSSGSASRQAAWSRQLVRSAGAVCHGLLCFAVNHSPLTARPTL